MPRGVADVLDEKLPLPPKRPPNFRDSGSLEGDGEVHDDVPRLNITGGLASPARNRPLKPHREPPLPLTFFLSASSPRIAAVPTSERTGDTPTLCSAMKSRSVLTQVSDASRASFASINSCLASSSAALSVWTSRRSFSLSTALGPGTGSDSGAEARENNPEMRRVFVGR